MNMENGILVRWQDEKGFGFIKPEAANGKDLFIHISELKHMARKPQVGDAIQYRTQQQADGKFKAINASIEGVAVISASATTRRKNNSNPGSKSQSPKTRSSSVILIPLIVCLALAAIGFKRYEALTATPVLTNENVEQMSFNLPTQNSALHSKQNFHCETGKEYCSQMRSCAEATFYINNCPNTKMDGNHDGVPCERQWCQ